MAFGGKSTPQADKDAELDAAVKDLAGCVNAVASTLSPGVQEAIKRSDKESRVAAKLNSIMGRMRRPFRKKEDLEDFDRPNASPSPLPSLPQKDAVPEVASPPEAGWAVGNDNPTVGDDSPAPSTVPINFAPIVQSGGVFVDDSGNEFTVQNGRRIDLPSNSHARPTPAAPGSASHGYMSRPVGSGASGRISGAYCCASFCGSCIALPASFCGPSPFDPPANAPPTLTQMHQAVELASAGMLSMASAMKQMGMTLDQAKESLRVLTESHEALAKKEEEEKLKAESLTKIFAEKESVEAPLPEPAEPPPEIEGTDLSKSLAEIKTLQSDLRPKEVSHSAFN